MTIQKWADDVVLVELPQQLSDHEELQLVIDTVLDRGLYDVIVDFSNTDIAGSLTLSRLMELRKLLTESGRRLVLCGVSPEVRGVFAVAQLERLFEFADDPAVALS
jgi:anti-anti-sigma factor